ncbi:high-affinity branched-chain amino acid ABC transporter ATP-binding protein LivG [Rhodopseudomonas palustris]|uniref:High-affinity branched-chain amino acid ABC transporter ATP-binding protein LivG n=1 Tax=Rhodopseudomonas palustris TaxID=1076 RepID=A0A323UB14_RHOPL|nr:ABC transporter ATP-binding protein [Rhodopseudomonas palustris]PZA09377.1 high-affinity branched-chain amino acid ABC transporter ATP-binding protein LivG [Rhodopseudomonas palustris]
MSLLKASDVGISFGGVKAIDGVGFSVAPGEILSIIGPNGAGKTTLFNVVSGMYAADHGRIELDGRDVTGLPPDSLASRGLSRTFQNLQIFHRMTAAENVMVGRHLQERCSLFADLLRLPSVTRQNQATRAAALTLLDQVGLRDVADVAAGSLSYGASKRLEIARALAAEPRVLLLDEPAAGCNSVETEEIDRLICRVADQGIAVVLVEHDMKLVMKISHRILVLNQGRMLVEGTPEEVRHNPLVAEAYLGRHGAREAARA